MASPLSPSPYDPPRAPLDDGGAAVAGGKGGALTVGYLIVGVLQLVIGALIIARSAQLERPISAVLGLVMLLIGTRAVAKWRSRRGRRS